MAMDHIMSLHLCGQIKFIITLVTKRIKATVSEAFYPLYDDHERLQSALGLFFTRGEFLTESCKPKMVPSHGGEAHASSNHYSK